MTFTAHTYEPVAAMNAARARKAATGGRTYKQASMSRADIRERDANMDHHEFALATVASMWSEFRSFAADSRSRAMAGDTFETEIPF